MNARDGKSCRGSLTTRTYAIRSALISTLGVVAIALASGSALATSFRLTDLGTLGGPSSQGVALNASGQATGSSTRADGEAHAFLWDGTTMRDPGSRCRAFCVSVYTFNLQRDGRGAEAPRV
jgi:probable HAF family extracellular repeat protein